MTETLVVNDGSADVNFVATKSTATGRERINDSTDLLAPELLVVRHDVSQGGNGNPKGCVVDRHLLQVSCVKRDATSEEAYTATINVTLAVPRSSNFSATDIERLHTIAKNASTSHLTALLRGEV